MGTDLQKFFAGYQQPSREKQLEALAGFSAAKNTMVGKALLKLTKEDGVWRFGMDNEILDTTKLLIAAPITLMSGFVAFYLGKVEAEKMQPLHMGPVDASTLPPVNSGTVPPGKSKPSGNGWQPQSSIEFVTQDATPLHLIYKTNSRGGLMATMGLAGDIAFAQSENPDRVYALVRLGHDSYQHSEFGLVYTPEITVEGWLDAAGNPVVDAQRLNAPDGLL